MQSNRGGKRPGAGRKAPAGVRKNISIRFSESELSAIQEQAKIAGMTISEYIRQKALQNNLQKV